MAIRVTVRGGRGASAGLAFTPDGKEVWVANVLGNDLAVVDPKSLKVVRRVNLGSDGRAEIRHWLGVTFFHRDDREGPAVQSVTPAIRTAARTASPGSSSMWRTRSAGRSTGT